MKITIVSLMIINTLVFSTVLVSDDFNDGNADGWNEEPTGATYTVEAGRYCFFQTVADEANAISWISDSPDVMSVPDYTCRINATIFEGSLAGMVGRFDLYQVHGYGLFIELEESDTLLLLARIDAPQEMEILATQQYSFSYGEEYWLRLEMNGNKIGGKCWTGSVGNEPGNWNLQVTDGTYQYPGVFALVGNDVNSGGSATTDVSFDDVEITDETTLDLQSNSWAFVKTLFR